MGGLGSLDGAEGGGLRDDNGGGVVTIGRAVGDGGSAANDGMDRGHADGANAPDMISLLRLAVIATRMNPMPVMVGLVVARIDDNSVMGGMPNVNIARRRSGSGLVLGDGLLVDALGQVNAEAGAHVNSLAQVDVETQLKETTTGNGRHSRGSKNKGLHGDEMNVFE